MGMRLNFADVEVGNFDALPGGWYLVTVTDTDIKQAGEKAKHPGSDFVKFEYTIDEPETVEVEDEKNGGMKEVKSKGRKFFDNASLLPNALFTLKEILLAVGEEADGELEFNPEDLHGQQIAVKVNVGTYDGEPTNNVKRRMPVATYYEKRGEEAGSLMP